MFDDDEEAIDLHDTDRYRNALEDPCPVCGGAVRSIKCKLVCLSCNALVENCARD